jgi:hypothetical protein
MEAFADFWEFIKLSSASGVMLWYVHLTGTFVCCSKLMPLTTSQFAHILQLGELVLQSVGVADRVPEER